MRPDSNQVFQVLRGFQALGLQPRHPEKRLMQAVEFRLLESESANFLPPSARCRQQRQRSRVSASQLAPMAMALALALPVVLPARSGDKPLLHGLSVRRFPWDTICH